MSLAIQFVTCVVCFWLNWTIPNMAVLFIAMVAFAGVWFCVGILAGERRMINEARELTATK